MRSEPVTSILSLQTISPVAVLTSCAFTRSRPSAFTKLPTSTEWTASSWPTWRGSTLCPAYGAMYVEGRTISERSWASSVMRASARANS